MPFDLGNHYTFTLLTNNGDKTFNLRLHRAPIYISIMHNDEIVSEDENIFISQNDTISFTAQDVEIIDVDVDPSISEVKTNKGVVIFESTKSLSSNPDI